VSWADVVPESHTVGRCRRSICFFVLARAGLTEVINAHGYDRRDSSLRLFETFRQQWRRVGGETSSTRSPAFENAHCRSDVRRERMHEQAPRNPNPISATVPTCDRVRSAADRFRHASLRGDSDTLNTRCTRPSDVPSEIHDTDR